MLARFFGAVEELPGAILIEGEAGIGKTSLLRASVAAAVDAGYRVLSCRPAESETAMGFSALRDLVGDVFRGSRRSRPSPLPTVA
jgi:predicted ATP-dependent serine protease